MRKIGYFIFFLLINSLFAARLIWLGSLQTPYAEPHGVSADGNVVAGWAGVSETHRAWRWTPDSGMVDIGSLAPGRAAEAWGLSADGRTVVGYAFINNTYYRGFYWREGNMYQLGTFGGDNSWAYGASFDGSVIVGSAETITGFNRAFRWQADSGMRSLGTLQGAIRSVARAVSFDGRVVVGWSGFANQIHHAFRWENGQMVDIHNPAFGQSEAIGISGNGEVVVGAWGPPDFVPARAFRWTRNTGMYDLGTLGGEWSEAWGADFYGRKIVGWAESSQGNWRAFLWTVENGMQNLNALYGYLLRPGSILKAAYAISADGRYLVGVGYNSETGRDEAFWLDTECSEIEEQTNSFPNNNFDIFLKSFGLNTKIIYKIPFKTKVEINLYDFFGRKVASLTNKILEPGEYETKLNINNLPAGIYFCELKIGYKAKMKKFPLLK